MNTKLRLGLLGCIAFFTIYLSEAQVVINEISSNNVSTYPDNEGDFGDWIELYNAGAAPVNLLNYKLSDSVGMPARWVFPSVSIPAGGYLTVFASGKDVVARTDHWEMIVKEEDTWKYIVPSSTTSTSWENPTFDDSGWDAAPGGFGYGLIGETTTVDDGTISIFMRKTFNVIDSAAIREMIFYADYDDGFVVFLNGEEITRDNISPAIPAFDVLANTARNTGGTMEGFSIDPSIFKPLLRNGSNLLAIEVHNVASSSDLLMRPFLMVGITNTSANYEATPAWFVPPVAGQAFIHTNFSIRADGGETITLADPANTIINSVVVPALGPNTGYGRFPNGSGTWALLSPATPNASNSTSTSYAGYLNATVSFSVPPGFYTGTQTVSCTCSDATAQVRYTTDGSKPKSSSTEYTGALSISSTRVLRAACFKTGYITQNFETNTYFIGDPASNIAVISISTHPNNFFHTDTGMYVTGPNASGAQPYYGANYWMDWEREVHIEYFDKGKAHRFEQDCGIKIFGGWSRANAMKSMRLVPDEMYGPKRITYPLFSEKPYVQEFSGVHLRNGGNDFNYTHLRDQTNHRVLQSEQTVLGNNTHIDFSAYEPILVFINGSYWGIHHLRERFSKGYFEQNHNVSEYEMLEMDGDVVKVDNAHFLNMSNFIGSNDMTNATNYNTVKGWLDIENFADYFIAETYHTNWDWPNNNVKYWRALPDGKWRYLYYDTDFAFHMFNYISPSSNELSNVINSTGGNNRSGIPNPHGPMLKKLLTNTEFKNYFVNRYADLMNTIYLPTNYKEVFDGLKSEMSPNMSRHFEKWPQNANSTTGWDAECDKVRDFMDDRHPYARDHVQSTFALAGKVTTTLQVNPAGAGVIKISTIVPDQYPWTGVYYNGVPVTLTAIANPGFAFSNWTSSVITLGSPTNSSITLNISASNTFTANFTTTTSVPKITINEINYNPDDAYDAGDWIEIYNHGNASMNLSGWKFKDADEFNTYVIPQGTVLGAGQYLVIAQDVTKFTALHPTVTNYIGPFNFGLAGSGEVLRLYDHLNRLYLSMSFDDASPWPLFADGQGTTLELIDPTKNLSDGTNWYDGCRGGSPGKAYIPCPCATVNLGPDKVLCSSGGSVLLNTGVTAHVDRVFKWYFNGALLPVTTPTFSASAAGVYQAVVDSFGCIKNDEVTLTSNLAINLGPDVTLCNPVTATLDSKLTGAGITYVWRKDGTIIPKETAATLSVKLAGTYQITASATGCTAQTDEVVVSSDAAVPGDAFRCDPGEVMITVDGPGTYEWYATPTGGSPIGTGSSFTTPSLTTTKTYYAKDAGSFGGTVGPDSPTEVGGEIWHGQHWDPEDDLYKMKFDILQPLFINAVTVFARGPQSVTVRVLEPDKTTVKFTKTVEISSAGENRIPLDFQFLAADVQNGYYMDLIGTTGELEYNGNGGNTNFPYVANDYMQITRTSASFTPSASWYFYVYKWEYGSGSAGSCERVPVTATIGCSLMAVITPAASTSICQGGSVILNSNTGAGYTHQWQKDGVNIVNATSSSYTATSAGSYTVLNTYDGESMTSPGVAVTVTPSPTAAAAGSDQVICAATAILAGNTAAIGTGTWTLVSGSASFTDAASPTSGVIGLGVGPNTLRWTISNSPCTASTNDVVITRSAVPTAALAGNDQSICAATATLAGNAPAAGTGSWSLVSGTATITDPTNRASGVTAVGVGSNTLRWTISNSPCTASTDDIVLTRSADPTPATAGDDQDLCATTTVLTGNAPIEGAGSWTVVSGTATITDPASPISEVTALGVGANTLRWTIGSSPCTPSTDDVIITRFTEPSPAVAGDDQALCLPTAILGGNIPAIGAGTWTVVTGTASISDPLSPTSAVTDLGVGSNTLRWTIKNGPCTASADDLILTRFADPTTAAAGVDQNICLPTASLTGNTPAIGTGIWTVVNGTATITSPGNPVSGVTELAVGSTTLRWTISNGPCISSTDDLVVTRMAEPTPATAGDDQELCAASTILSGNEPAIGTGAWTVVSGTATISDPLSRTSAVTALGAGATTLRWTISNSPCTSSTDDLILTRFTNPTPATAGADQNVCATTASLSGNEPLVGTGTWTVVTGTATITNPTSPTSAVTGLVVGENTFRWTISNGPCIVSTDEVTILRDDVPTAADAGTDQNLCVNTTTLAAGPLSTGVGVWSIVSGTAAITDPTSPTSGVTGLGLGANIVRWTTDNGSCSSLSDEVTLTRTDPPTPANAGTDQSVCTSTTSLAGNVPTSGLGVWALVSGTGTITSPASPTTGVTGLGVGDNTFSWTITSGSCGSVSDEVVITVNPSSPASVIISPSSNPVCVGSAVILTASPINGGIPSYSWKVNGVDVGTDSYEYTLSSPNQGDVVSVAMTSTLECATGSPATSSIVLSVDETPSTASAGPDQNICSTTATLAGDAPTVGTGTWSVVSGTATVTNPASPSSGVTGLGMGSTTLRWTTIHGACPSSSDDVLIAVNSLPTISNAGTDKSVCTESTTLSGNIPTVGIGAWSLVSGTATVDDPSNPLSTVSDLEVGSEVTLRWIISNGSCTPSQDEVIISRINLPTTADAGADQIVCATSTTLSGNIPSIGTGSWSVVSGTAVINEPTDPATTISGLGTGATILKWTISNGSCTVSADEVTINVTGGITTADAGLDQDLCIGTSTLSANSPILGVGSWTVVSGTANIASPSDPASEISELGVGTNILRWTISNSPCVPSTDDVTITRYTDPTPSIAGADQDICSSPATLSGNIPAIGTGNWTVVNGTASFSEPSSPTSEVTGLGTGINTLRWTISSGPCAVSSDEMVINVTGGITTADAGLEQSVCTDASTLSANTPSLGTGLWTLVSGTGNITTPSSPTSEITGLGVGTNILRWTISNGPCIPSTDDVTIIRLTDPTPAAAGVDQDICATSATLSGNSPAVGMGNWSVVSGPATVTDPSNPNSGVTGLGVGTNILQWTTINGPCTSSMDEMIINVNEIPTTANAGPDVDIEVNVTYLAGNTPEVGIGTWTAIVGGGFIGTLNDPTTSVGGLPIGENTYRWTITNGTCPPSFDEVTITVGSPPPFEITGPDNVVAGQTYTFSVPNEPGASNFWSVPSGASIITGNGTNSITVSFGTNASGTISVTKSSGPTITTATKNVNQITSVKGPVDTDSYSIYPNPFLGQTGLVITTPSIHKVLIKVMDMKGILVYESEKHFTNENIILGNEFPEGIYIVQAIYKDKLITLKIVKAEN